MVVCGKIEMYNKLISGEMTTYQSDELELKILKESGRFKYAVINHKFQELGVILDEKDLLFINEAIVNYFLEKGKNV
jgi:hypothetical protein